MNSKAIACAGVALICLGGMTEERSAGQSKVWQPAAAAGDAPVEAARVRIVDFGADFLRGGDGQSRHHFHCHRYVLEKDKNTGLWRPNDRPVQLDLRVDVDGDGRTDDDVVGYHEFSLDRPFNPIAPWYDTLAGTPRWYGGQAIYQANRRSSGFSEDGVNQDHDGPFCWPRENWAVFHETYEIYSPYRLAVNWLWLKQDFLNGGATNQVTFDEESRLALVLKRYFMCIDSVRFLVRDGRQCYLSEATFSLVGTHTLRPTKTRWAKYDPKGHTRSTSISSPPSSISTRSRTSRRGACMPRRTGSFLPTSATSGTPSRPTR